MLLGQLVQAPDATVAHDDCCKFTHRDGAGMVFKDEDVFDKS